MEELRVIFVLPAACSGEKEVSGVMYEAFGTCKETVSNVEWVAESDFPSYNLAKTDFVVFETFEGKDFDSLKNSKCARILGPRCLLGCLIEGRPIPNYPWPIYNLAMENCVIACSNLPKSTKATIKEKVQFMGGCYSDDLTCKNTHLITESVKSQKYLQAAENNVKIMTGKWVDMVWEASLTRKVHCTNDEFSKYKCLPFHDLTISSTGFPSTEMRQELAEKIVGNGGVFTGALAIAKTDVLVVYGVNGVLSDKYKAARKNPDISCVGVNWVTDSIEKGYALPHHMYRVHKGTSTPTKDGALRPDFSMISAIGSHSGRLTQVEDTVLRGATPALKRVSPPNKRKVDDFGALIDGLDIKKAKRAGQYLDGCSVFVAGFTSMQREKLCKILNLSGATRYDDISDRLTHVIIGDSSCHEVKILKSKNYPISLVSIHWLLDSIEKQQAAEEDNYLINLHDGDQHMFSSPLSQKGLNLLISKKTLTSQEVDSGDSSASNKLNLDSETTLMQQYLRTSSGDDDSDTLQKLIQADSKFAHLLTSEANFSQSVQQSIDDASSQEPGIFVGKKFSIIGFNYEDTNLLKEQIECDSGAVVSKSFKGIPDYVVAPMVISSPIPITGQTTVNNLWIIECTEEGEVRPLLYYHEPLFVSNAKPLENCVITTSGYSLFEKKFLKALIGELGGICQEQFARVASEAKQLLASTHLISLEANGKKYEGALKWGLPVVKKEWLFECAQKGQRVLEDEYVIGDSKTNGTVMNSTATSKTKRILTPQNQKEPLNISVADKTPINQRLFCGGSITDTPEPCSQVTPINKLMEEVRKTNLLGTPQTPPKLKPLVGFDTPPSPFGAFLEPHMSAKSKKELMRYLDRIPDFRPQRSRRLSTPLSEVKRRCLKKLLGEDDSLSASIILEPNNLSIVENLQNQSIDQSHQNQIDAGDINEGSGQQVRKNDSTCTEGSENEFINTKLLQLQEAAKALSKTRRGSRNLEPTVPSDVGLPSEKDSQSFSVGWDFDDPSTKQTCRRIFVLSGIDNDIRQSIVEKIEKLGAQVSDLASYDPKCTHLLSVRPARNEKTLACMAAGKWILHISYVEKSVAAGRFLDEEQFEFGNPKSKDRFSSLIIDKETEVRYESMHWWRKEINRRGYGAFNDMRAIVVAQKRDPIIRVIEAGGGQVITAMPPFDDSVHATHCLLEMKSVPDFSVFNSLAQRGVLCINTLYISEFLYRTNKDVQDAILPQYVSFYK